MSAFRALWLYRNFIISSIRNDLASRFARSKLGGLWMLINPLSQVLIYALILSNVLSAKLPGIENKYAYSIYLMAGLLCWSLFNEIISRSTTLFIEQGNLIKKMNFPKITLPTITIGVCLINNIILFAAMAVIFLLLGNSFSTAIFLLIPLTMLTVLLAIGIGLSLGVLNVFLRDIGQVIPIVLQVWFWFTPIVYPSTIIPEQYRSLLELNPVYPIVNAYQQILVYNNIPDLNGLISSSAIAAALVFLALFLYTKSTKEMADVL